MGNGGDDLRLEVEGEFVEGHGGWQHSLSGAPEVETSRSRTVSELRSSSTDAQLRPGLAKSQ